VETSVSELLSYSSSSQWSQNAQCMPESLQAQQASVSDMLMVLS
jgi:hypothetical protein